MEKLPNEICVNIVYFLAIKDIGSLSQVSDFWKTFCADDIVWRDRITKFYPNFQSALSEDVLKLPCKLIYKELIGT